jgi:hypothetical protein
VVLYVPVPDCPHGKDNTLSIVVKLNVVDDVIVIVKTGSLT